MSNLLLIVVGPLLSGILLCFVYSYESKYRLGLLLAEKEWDACSAMNDRLLMSAVVYLILSHVFFICIVPTWCLA